ncbi:MAG: invasion associated locus B family protein [Rhodobacter sp.]|uniref:invasion associated locus B family protein n=1 Tax=Pararhodobacter sp. TaxID=2127056 RepID=UPI001D94E6EA|nr:invasion associated locus B family protein [Pararhodobacter sp.]MCB1344300.1 invasion associated locus B family protein [Paracoccaceae bacterium]MCC0073381.1 invasion associated locus B family protein [Rhodobacter sp.]HPD91159.1 invasion associated locus B family protein [Pararhodobacter sp.]
MTLRFALLPGLATAALLAASSAMAQDSGSAAPAQTPAPAQSQPAAPQPFVAATHGSWQIICPPEEANGPTGACEMYQLLNDAQGSPTAEISIAALPLGAEFSAGASVTTPLETFLPAGLAWYIGDRPADEQIRVEPFRVCSVVGCLVRMGLSADEVDAMKAGSNATLLMRPFVAVDQEVSLTVSLSGFTAAYEDLQTRLSNAAAAQRSQNN